MRNPINSRVGTVVAAAAVLAVFTGGTAAVAGGLVTSRDIKDDTIRHADMHPQTLKSGDISRDGVGASEIREDAVGQSEIAAGAVGLAELADDARAAMKGDPGEPGKDGTNGKDGAAGAPGKDGVSGYTIEGPEARWSNGPGTVTASCPTGKVALGGGFTVEGIRGGDATIKKSAPVYVSQTNASGWTVAGVATGEANVKAWAICASVN